MTNESHSPLMGEVLEEEVEVTLAELCRACQVPAERLFELVEEGVVEPFLFVPYIFKNPSNKTTSPFASKTSFDVLIATVTVVFSSCAGAIWLARVRRRIKS